MGAIRTKLESFKQPKQGKVIGGKVTPQKFGGKVSGGKGLDPSKAFYMMRSLQKDEDSRNNAMVSAGMMTTKRAGVMDRDSELLSTVDAKIAEIDELLHGLGIE